MSARSLGAVPLFIVALLAVACGVETEPTSTDLTGPTPAAAESPTPAPPESPTPATDPGDGQQDLPERESEPEEQRRPAAAGDCAAYANSGGWCTDRIGDYDCEGGTGDGPNYAPPDIEVINPGTDPFGLDRDDDGEGCEGSAPAPPAPPPPPDPGTDPRFDTCGDAIAAGYGPYHQGQDPEYDWYRDADSDGIVCER